MATKCKPQGPRCNKFDIWTKVAKLAKPHRPKWQFTLKFLKIPIFIYFHRVWFCNTFGGCYSKSKIKIKLC
ncbi:hypothetical protein Hanom_Chr08g00743261 [Helianthus anomalus]